METAAPLFAGIVFDRPLDQAYTYSVPAHLVAAIAIGKRVEVPFGRGSQTPATIATLSVVCVLFALALVLIEIGLNQEVSASKVASKLASSLSRNPLLVGPAAGLVVAVSGWQLPGGVETFFRLLGSSVSCGRRTT